MATSSLVDYSMKNNALFQALKKIGVKFNADGSECRLASGEVYMFCYEDGYGIPYLGFDDNFMIGMYLEYFLACGNEDFNYQFMKIMTENGYFESDYDFDTNPFDINKYYDRDFYSQFTMTKKLTDFDSTIEEAHVEGIEYDGEITAFRASVANGVMTILDLQFEFETEDFFELDEFWDMMDDAEKEEFTTKKIWQDGCWTEQ